MNDTKKMLLVVGLVIHPLAAIALVFLIIRTGVMAGFCLGSGALIAFAAVPTMPRRPIALSVAFALFMGFGFWLAVSGINQRSIVDVILAMVAIAAAVWLLRQPCWPSTIFAAVFVVLGVGLAMLNYHERFHFVDEEPDRVLRSSVTSIVVLALGLLYLSLGFAEASLLAALRKKRALRRVAGQRLRRSD